MNDRRVFYKELMKLFWIAGKSACGDELPERCYKRWLLDWLTKWA